MTTPHILMIGTASIDLVFHVKQFPTRAEKYRADSVEAVGGGGAANAAVGVARLGGKASVAARLGNDETADAIEQGLKRENVRLDFLQRFQDCQSSTSAVLIDPHGERLVVNYRDVALPSDATWLTRMLDESTFEALLADTRWPEGAFAGMHHARERGLPGIIDAEAPIEGSEEALRLASHVVFSAQGLRDFHRADPNETDIEGLLRRTDCGDGIVGVTDGVEGVRWMEGGTVHHLRPPTIRQSVTDTLGAGDIWHGALALALAEAQGLSDAMRLANAAATLKCVGASGRNGAPRRAEVEQLLRANDEGPS